MKHRNPGLTSFPLTNIGHQWPTSVDNSRHHPYSMPTQLLDRHWHRLISVPKYPMLRFFFPVSVACLLISFFFKSSFVWKVRRTSDTCVMESLFWRKKSLIIKLLAANKTNFIGGSRLLLYKGNVFLNIYGNNLIQLAVLNGIMDNVINQIM